MECEIFAPSIQSLLQAIELVSDLTDTVRTNILSENEELKDSSHISNHNSSTIDDLEPQKGDIGAGIKGGVSNSTEESIPNQIHHLPPPPPPTSNIPLPPVPYPSALGAASSTSIKKTEYIKRDVTNEDVQMADEDIGNEDSADVLIRILRSEYRKC